MTDLQYQIERREGKGAFGYLSWPAHGLRSGAVSGPHGNGVLPEGLYHLERSGYVERSPDDSNGAYCDSLQQCWFQFVEPQFSTDRSELGIHPDGNAAGTSGCIGIVDGDTAAWREAFRANAGTLTLEVS